jgi:hypothetical protein
MYKYALYLAHTAHPLNLNLFKKDTPLQNKGLGERK